MRRSKRSRSKVDYAELGGYDMEDGGGGDREEVDPEEKETMKVGFGGLCRSLQAHPAPQLPPSQRIRCTGLGAAWIARGGLAAGPVVVQASGGHLEALGVTRPGAPGCTLATLLAAAGLDTEVRTFDSSTQKKGPSITLGQWLHYWHRASTDPPAMDVKGRPVESRTLAIQEVHLDGRHGQFSPPLMAREADLSALAWPHGHPGRPKPRAGLACFRAGCARDFTVAASGAATWFHVISGAGHVVAVPPTTDNLEAYTFWQTTERWEGASLGETVEGAWSTALAAGETLVVPSGWPVAYAFTSSTVALHGSFLHPYALGAHMDIHRMEDRLGRRHRKRAKTFRDLMWFTAGWYLRRLAKKRAALSSPQEEEEVSKRTPALKKRRPRHDDGMDSPPGVSSALRPPKWEPAAAAAKTGSSPAEGGDLEVVVERDPLAGAAAIGGMGEGTAARDEAVAAAVAAAGLGDDDDDDDDDDNGYNGGEVGGPAAAATPGPAAAGVVPGSSQSEGGAPGGSQGPGQSSRSEGGAPGDSQGPGQSSRSEGGAPGRGTLTGLGSEPLTLSEKTSVPALVATLRGWWQEADGMTAGAGAGEGVPERVGDPEVLLTELEEAVMGAGMQVPDEAALAQEPWWNLRHEALVLAPADRAPSLPSSDGEDEDSDGDMFVGEVEADESVPQARKKSKPVSIRRNASVTGTSGEAMGAVAGAGVGGGTVGGGGAPPPPMAESPGKGLAPPPPKPAGSVRDRLKKKLKMIGR